METAKSKFIGSGLTFPIELNPLRTKPIVYEGDPKLIRSSIGIILNWPKRRRWFNEYFGCRIEEVLEEPDNNISRTLIKTFIKEALNTWEKRINVKEIIVNPPKTPGEVLVYINYEIRNTKIEETVIFPFYTQILY